MENPFSDPTIKESIGLYRKNTNKGEGITRPPLRAGEGWGEELPSPCMERPARTTGRTGVRGEEDKLI